MELFNGDSKIIMSSIGSNSVDLTVTSPPYDDLRSYGKDFTGWCEDDWKQILLEIYRVTKEGGVVVWIVSDETKNGSETGTSFKQALFAKEIGFNLHDTMIWNKGGFSGVGALKVRYAPVFEYMFVFSKGKPKTFHPLTDRPNKHAGKKISKTKRQKDGTTKKGKSYISRDFGQRFNIWGHSPHRQRGGHPAPFPVNLVEDHIVSWSDELDTVLDPFMGSGTTGVACKNLSRNFIGIELDEGYFKIASERIESA